eukprot:Phypoly_transcript_03753.p1 GENE.Phypoly_transcript_03753~~Phypoly_transcript_03753.p1  ORF type:complete len:473 (+),score=57.39 Phypoly_transcript_03753:113-1531(+)
MVLVVEASLSSTVFFPGDTLFCRVVVSSKSDPNDANAKPPKEELISWISLQVHGKLLVDPSYVELSQLAQQQRGPKRSGSMSNINIQHSNKSNIAQTSHQKFTPPLSSASQLGSFGAGTSVGIGGAIAGTSLPNLADCGENGRCVFATPPTILACELKVSPGASKVYMLQATLPGLIPPTFKGTGIKYRYAVTVAAQRMREAAHLLTVPFRVVSPTAVLKKIEYPLGFPGFDYEIRVVELESPDEGKWIQFQQRQNQYLSSPYPQTKSQHDTNQSRNAVYALFEKHSNPVTMQISKGPERLVSFTIGKIAYQLGETVSGTFDFSNSVVPCYQILVRLESEEVVDPSISKSKPIRKIYSEHHECTRYTIFTSFTFYIPHEASQEFTTEQVTVRWSLHFEFVTPQSARPSATTPPTTPQPAPRNQQRVWPSISENEYKVYPPPVEVVSWVLPIRVLVHTYTHELLYTSPNVMTI